ncbi:chemotaxis protein CheA [Stakelama marina]|uniref:Chemotaxis protein CheA n=1 Tax=Stakelama marina TaxID=2826939 RepID=A0A8T4IDB5_9SPHN|nr:chemotaxis protein CheA [Stakelama marina]MBR0550975.1 chemotaxis protein CheA [Stakelama marina]
MTRVDPAETFRQEAQELLEQLETTLLDLEQAPADRELVDAAFRALHTIKGSGAMFGFTAVAEFVHGFETAFDRVRKSGQPISADLVTLALQARDHVDGLINDPDADTAGGARILTALDAIAPQEGGASDASVAEPVSTAAADGVAGRWRVRFKLPADALAMGTNPLLRLDELAEIGPATISALTDDIPLLDELDPECCYIGWEVVIEATDPQAAIEDVFLFQGDDLDLEVSRIDEPAGEAAAVPGDAPEEKAAPRSEVVTATSAPAAKAALLRVPAERLDALMDQVGELVIAQTRLSELTADGAPPALQGIAEELERLIGGLRDTSMGIRMVPIGSLFGRFRRLVSDLSRSLGKEIEFVTSGEETELDKTVIERLADPLVHLIRNAVDHGLENPDARVAAGKPAAGTVRLAAIYSGAEVTVTLTDDGAGLNAARIRQKAEENGIISPDAEMRDEEIYPLIFAPGFSTAAEVTELSGRGVGMDVVKQTIEALRGTIDLTSEPGRGTTITLRLPLTLAIIDGMLVRVGDGRYSIPMAAVEECVELPASAVDRRGRDFLNIRGQIVPFLRLRELFRAEGETSDFQKVVVVSAGDARVGLAVDQILGNHQVVIKQLSRLHSGLNSFSGATILGDGSVSLILNVAQLIGMGAMKRTPAGIEEREAA